ncbi:MAG: prolyl oligopeptidase family serine peptidase [Dehalococcoidales bacterium]|nr:prolyl oligopeptidase family serine peptidase [Dehalococcoidales bacterium]
MVTKTIILEVEGLKIVGQLYLPGGRPPYPTVCICHGIPSGNPNSGDGGYPVLAERICHENFAVLIFNFRGTGASEGNIDLLGWSRDLTAAIDYLCSLPEVDRSHLSLLGFSGGAAVSIYVASQDSRVSYVAACSCPAEFGFLAGADNLSSAIDRFRRIGLIRDKDFPYSMEEWANGFAMVSPINHIAGIVPRTLLLVHGGHDEVVDVSHAYKLYARAGEPKQIIIVSGAGQRLRQNERAMAIVIDWLKSQRVN